MPSKYDLTGFPPPEVIENVELFIEGKATFHELPRKQGRRHRVIRTIVGETDAGSNDVRGVGTGNLEGPVSPGSDVPSPGERASSAGPEKRRRRRLPPGSVPSGTGPRVQTSIPVTETDSDRTERIRKTLQRPRKRRKIVEQVHAFRGTVQTVDADTGEVLSSRGPTVEEEAEAFGKTVQEVQKEQQKALPTPEPTGVETVAKRKRGRPRKEKQ